MSLCLCVLFWLCVCACMCVFLFPCFSLCISSGTIKGLPWPPWFNRCPMRLLGDPLNLLSHVKYKPLFCSFCLFPNTSVDILLIDLVLKSTTFCSPHPGSLWPVKVLWECRLSVYRKPRALLKPQCGHSPDLWATGPAHPSLRSFSPLCRSLFRPKLIFNDTLCYVGP